MNCCPFFIALFHCLQYDLLMHPQYNIEKVRQIFASRNFILSSDQYINNKEKLKYICPKGHETAMSLSNFNKGQNCGKCKTNNLHSYEYVKSKFIARGFELLSKEYKGKNFPLLFKCDKGHTGTILFNSLLCGAGCKICNKAKLGNNIKYTYSFVKNKFEEIGYKLLPKEYMNSWTKLKYICDKGHEKNILFRDFLKGIRCADCAKNKRLSFDEVGNEFKKAGYELLITKDEYKNAMIKMPFICNKGHKHEMLYSDLKFGRRCGKCFGTKRHGIESIRNEFENAGYNLLTNTYTNIYQQLEYVCNNGHKNSMRYNNFQQGARCPKCVFKEGASNQEQNLLSSIKLFYNGNIETNNRSLIKPYEIDIYFPDNQLAIEYCGLYWHSDAIKPNNYHRMKYDMCKAKGIQLLTIFEDEWINHKKIILSMIKAKLGLTQRIYARKCFVKEIDSATARFFFLDNHIQGAGRTLKAVGLFYEDEIVFALSISKPSRAHTKHQYVINRMATKTGFNVIGGASKVFKFLLSFVDFDNIATHCDLRYGTGNVYNKLGFNLIAESKYTPHYVKGNQRFRNQTLAKTKEEKLTGKTEVELRREQGYRRIFDCGHQTYQYIH